MRRGSGALLALSIVVFGLSACGGGPLVGVDGAENAAAVQQPTATPGIEGLPSVPTGNEPLFVDPSAPASPSQSVEPAVSAPPAPVSAEPAPSLPAEPAASPTVNPALGGVQLPQIALPSNEARWRYVQVERTPFDSARTYTTPSRQVLWWYNPQTGQQLILGELQGNFPVQATFRFRGQEAPALEVPFEISQATQGLGLDRKVPDAIIDQMKRAGAVDWVEAFIYQTGDIRPQ